MSKKLYLIRHSYAEEPNANKDFDRRLTQAGQTMVRSLGRYITDKKMNPDILLASPSVRTTETAIKLVEELVVSEQLISYEDVIYNASVRELLAVVNGISKDHKEVMIIGHNPAITFFGEFLTGSVIGNMEPAGIVSIKFDFNSWEQVSQSTGILEYYYHPSHGDL